jgi:hypothetical protein
MSDKRIIDLSECCGAEFDAIKAELATQGIDFEDCCGAAAAEGGRVKIVCVSPNLKSSVAEMGKSPRDRVVMVRVDEETSRLLDAWVESGAVKSRSEAAALFIREGMQVRSSELAQLQQALKDVDEARARLHAKAREVFGESSDEDPNEEEK